MMDYSEKPKRKAHLFRSPRATAAMLGIWFWSPIGLGMVQESLGNDEGTLDYHLQEQAKARPTRTVRKVRRGRGT
ncbi:MAG: hypothetical protein K8J31_15800 [Anaerolineae bacterium]|nr:hypothetical protein [Anaerolineae bacterium]